MPRPRQVDVGTLRNLLASRDHATALELAELLDVSRPTISRLLRELGDEVVRLGAARAARYSLRRTIRNIGHTWPVHRVNEAGDVIPAGNLEAVRGGFRLTDIPPILQTDFPEGFFEGQPFFFNDVQPQGFLGRVQARRIAAVLGVPTDAREWTAEDILVYLTTYGDDLPGDLVVGAEMAERIRRRDFGAITDGLPHAIPVSARAERYPELADRIMRGESFGTSAGGEQPKFATWVLEEGDLPRAVIVKFSPPTNTLAGRRWADLLLTESLALEVLREVGIATPGVQVVDAGQRRFLEVTRYDRVGARGRRGVISLLSAEIGIVRGKLNDWVDMANALEQQGLLAANDAAQLRRLWCFGKLIANVDMHKGNASLWWRSEKPLGLAPVYDMLPMAFGPSPQGELITRPYDFPARTPELDQDWEIAIPWALEFWNRVLGNGAFAPDFVTQAQIARQRVEDFRFRASSGATAPATSVASASFETRYPQVAQALQDQKKRTETTVTRDENRSTTISSEINAILAAGGDLEPFVASLFPEGMDAEAFVRFSFDAYRYLGVSDEVRAFMGKLWVDVLRRWTPEARVAFLQRIIADKFQIFEALDFVSEVFRHLRFPADVMLPWLREARQKLGNDLYQRGFWKTVSAYTEYAPHDALEVAFRWLEQNPDDTFSQVIARIVGLVRGLPATPALNKQLEALENRLRSIGRADWRALYLQSWAQVFGARSLTEKKALELRDEIASQGISELTAWCYLLATVVQSDSLARPWAHRELARIASPELEPAARHWITVASFTAWEDASDTNEISRAQWEDLVLAVLPFGKDENGLWNRLDYFLREILQRAPDRTLNFLTRLVRRAPVWLEKLKQREFEGYLSSIRQHNLHETLATRLCLGDTSPERQLGLQLFAYTFVERLNPKALAAAEARRVELIFREAQTQLVDFAAIARLHASLAPQAARVGNDFVEDFTDEVELQAKNSNAYRTALVKFAHESEVLRKMIEEAEASFRRLQEAYNSPALQMQVPGRFRAEQLFRRRFSRDVERSVDKHSVFLRMVKRVQLLYGKNWRMLGSAGELGPASPLQETSHSVELPRLEFMDPEGMRLRRLGALQRIKQLTDGGEQT
jgi:hypothetical protein